MIGKSIKISQETLILLNKVKSKMYGEDFTVKKLSDDDVIKTSFEKYLE